MAVEFDLLGDPIPEGFGKRGRPPHLVTDEKRRVVSMLCAFGRGEEFIADALGITAKTLRKHYFRELRPIDKARAMLDAKLLASIMAKIDAGDTSAMALMFKRLDKQDMHQLAKTVANRGSEERRPPAKGKKEQQSEAAQQVGGKFAPPPSPPRLIN